MSNHSTIQHIPLVDEAWKKNCCNDLSQCALECGNLMESLRKSRSQLAKLKSGMSSLRQLDDRQVEKLGGLLHQTETQLSKVARWSDEMKELSRRIDQKAITGLRLTAEQVEAQSRQLVRDQARLGELAIELTSDIVRTRQIGTDLIKMMNIADAHSDEINEESEKGRELESRLALTWTSSQNSLVAFQELGDKWHELGVSLDRDLIDLESRLITSVVQIEALNRNEPATYAVLRGLLNREYELTQISLADSGIEAFLSDRTGRKIAFQARRDALDGREMLLELDLEGFDPAEKHRDCDQELNEILDDLADTGSCQTNTRVHPHQGRSGPDLLKPYPKHIKSKSRPTGFADREKA